MLGAGGHAAGLAEILYAQGRVITALVAPEPVNSKSLLVGIKRLQNDEDLLLQYCPKDVELVNGLGSLPGKDLQWQLFQFFKTKGYSFSQVISHNAILSNNIELGEGAQIMAGVIVQAGVTIGDNTLLNSGCIVEHDCSIGQHNHIAPSATLCGGVNTGIHVHIGAGANVIQYLNIGDHAVIGAGTTIARDVLAHQTLIPACSRNLS
nr:NeuD/PglB/VioB family sugar acetyltransferase [Oceanisphaera pacifica]